MNESRDPQALSVSDTAKGIAVRAGVLAVAGLVVGTWLFSLAAKAASGVVKIFTALVLFAIGGGFAAWQVRKVRQHLSAPDPSRPALR